MNPMWLRTYLSTRDVSKTMAIKVIFHSLFFSFFIFSILLSYEDIGSRVLNRAFLSSDIFEFLTVIILIYLYYYIVFRGRFTIQKKIIWIVVVFALLLLQSYNKVIIRSLILNETEILLNTESVLKMSFQLTSYIGLGLILFILLWILDHIQPVFNSNTYETQNVLKMTKNQLLRQQFNPHFLFNAFNSLYSLSLSNNPKTPEAILKLSNMMRYVTDNSTNALVRVNQELKFIKEYISIERLRFGNKAEIKIDLQNIPNNLFIEPLLLITLVENAFKHGFYTNDNQSFVHIKANYFEKELIFTVVNSIQKKQHFQINDRNGTGINNLKNRLQLSYPKTSILKINQTDSYFLAELKIKINEA